MKRKLFAALILILTSYAAHAVVPASGLWWNPNESGRGYTIDTQGPGIMIITAYVYAHGGTATWFFAAGVYDNATNTFSAPFGAFSGGQCFGCPYTKPVGVPAGDLKVVFSSPETAVLTFGGVSIPIVHEVFGYPNQTDYFLGEWSFSLGGGGLISTQWIVFNDHYAGSDGTVYAAGQEDSTSGTAALAIYNQPTHSFIVVIQDNVGFDFEYVFPLGDDHRMLGLGAIFSTGTNPPTPSDPSSGNRLLFPSELNGSTPLSRAIRMPNYLSAVDKQARYAAIENQMAVIRSMLNSQLN